MRIHPHHIHAAARVAPKALPFLRRVQEKLSGRSAGFWILVIIFAILLSPFWMFGLFLLFAGILGLFLGAAAIAGSGVLGLSIGSWWLVRQAFPLHPLWADIIGGIFLLFGLYGLEVFVMFCERKLFGPKTPKQKILAAVHKKAGKS